MHSVKYKLQYLDEHISTLNERLYDIMRILIFSVDLICDVSASAGLSSCCKPSSAFISLRCHVVHPGWLNSQLTLLSIKLNSVLFFPTHPSSNTAVDSQEIYDTTSSVWAESSSNSQQKTKPRVCPPLVFLRSLSFSVNGLFAHEWNLVSSTMNWRTMNDELISNLLQDSLWRQFCLTQTWSVFSDMMFSNCFTSTEE